MFRAASGYILTTMWFVGLNPTKSYLLWEFLYQYTIKEDKDSILTSLYTSGIIKQV
jgi:hypothetical protein